MNRTTTAIVAAVALMLAAAGAWLWWQHVQQPGPGAWQQPTPAATTPVTPQAGAGDTAPAIKHPIDAVDLAAAASAPATAAPADLPSGLAALFGRKVLLSMIQQDDFPRRFVATVDNLGRTYAAASMWPVIPTPGRLVVERRDGAEVISADNGLRYTPHVLVLEAIELPQAVALYRQFYPQFQQAYVELGYPNGYFNDRLIEVIDQLLATPTPAAALKVHLPEISGPHQPARPWVLYEFTDPALTALSAGQKTLLRMGPVNQRRVKARLLELRALLTRTPPR